MLALKRVPPTERVGVVLEKAPAKSWEADFARALADAHHPAERADVGSEAVGDVAALFGSRARWSDAALRVQALGGVLLTIVGFIRGDRVGALGALGIAIVGASVVLGFGRRTTHLEKEQRQRVDDLVGLLLPDASPEEAARKRARRAERVW